MREEITHKYSVAHKISGARNFTIRKEIKCLSEALAKMSGLLYRVGFREGICLGTRDRIVC